MKIRFGIRTLLLAVAIIACFFPFNAIYCNWFRASYSGFHIHDVLGHRVTNGDSFDYVSTLFDRSDPYSEEWARKHFTQFRDYKDGDEYYIFHVDGGNARAFFQFRDHLVVNHNKALHQMPYSQVQHNDDVAPNILFRFGGLPVYIGILVLSAIAIWVVAFMATRLQRIAG